MQTVRSNNAHAHRPPKSYLLSIRGCLRRVMGNVSRITTQVEAAERDRIEFRQPVQNILAALTRRFNSNGHETD